MFTSLKDITNRREKEDIDIQVTVKTKGKISKYGNDGQRLSGLFEDNSSKVDFISWKDMVNYVDANLQQGQTYIIRNIKVKKCSKIYTKTGKDVQLLFTSSTVISKCEIGPLYCPVELTKVVDIKEVLDGEKVNVAGKIVHVGDYLKQNNAERLTIRLKDETGTICASFWRASAQNFEGHMSKNKIID